MLSRVLVDKVALLILGPWAPPLVQHQANLWLVHLSPNREAQNQNPEILKGIAQPNPPLLGCHLQLVRHDLQLGRTDCRWRWSQTCPINSSLSGPGTHPACSSPLSVTMEIDGVLHASALLSTAHIPVASTAGQSAYGDRGPPEEVHPPSTT